MWNALGSHVCSVTCGMLQPEASPHQLWRLTHCRLLPPLPAPQRLLDNYGLKLQCTCKNELLIEDPKASRSAWAAHAGKLPERGGRMLHRRAQTRSLAWHGGEEGTANACLLQCAGVGCRAR